MLRVSISDKCQNDLCVVEKRYETFAKIVMRRDEYFAAIRREPSQERQRQRTKYHWRRADKKIADFLVQAGAGKTVIQVPQFARCFVGLKQAKTDNLMAKNFGKNKMTGLMNRRADPGRPKNSLPADRAEIIFLRPFLKLGKKVSEGKKNAKKANDLYCRCF